MNGRYPCDKLTFMKEQILLFELNDEKQKQLLRQALMPLRIRLKTVSRGQYQLTIGELTNAEPANSPVSAGNNQVTDAAVKDETAIPEPMLVFCGLSSARLDAVLAALRRKGVRIPHKAVLTPHNAEWTPVQLFSELDEEHKRFQSNDK